MRLLSLEVQNYRNIRAARLEPGRELTVICGNNGQGKTLAKRFSICKVS